MDSRRELSLGPCPLEGREPRAHHHFWESMGMPGGWPTPWGPSTCRLALDTWCCPAPVLPWPPGVMPSPISGGATYQLPLLLWLSVLERPSLLLCFRRPAHRVCAQALALPSTPVSPLAGSGVGAPTPSLGVALAPPCRQSPA